MLRRILSLLFLPESPRREAADEIETKIVQAEEDNRKATLHNLRAVQRLIDDSLKIVNQRTDDA